MLVLEAIRAIQINTCEQSPADCLIPVHLARQGAPSRPRDKGPSFGLDLMGRFHPMQEMRHQHAQRQPVPMKANEQGRGRKVLRSVSRFVRLGRQQDVFQQCVQPGTTPASRPEFRDRLKNVSGYGCVEPANTKMASKRQWFTESKIPRATRHLRPEPILCTEVAKQSVEVDEIT